ncbi:MAG: inositol monophosphatase family protein [Desulfuromonadales bacterium]|nr:inositol monophosphatase family protein [Desulfuromonadales bacterium]
MKSLLLKMVDEAGRLLLEMFDKGIAVEFKGADDLVTAADRACEAHLVALLRQHCPDHDILAEEGDYGARRSSHCWIIDPLDGTTNYAHGFPWFAVSIALQVDDRLVLGAVCNPYTREIYLAERGRGATLNDRPLRVSTIDRLDRAMLATGFAYDHKENPVNNYDHFEHFQRAAQACRRPGVASLDLACVAAGRFDGFWEMNLKPWDIAAGVLLVEEAGGRVSDFAGTPMPLTRREILASNGLLHQPMQTILAHGRRLPVADAGEGGR